MKALQRLHDVEPTGDGLPFGRKMTQKRSRHVSRRDKKPQARENLVERASGVVEGDAWDEGGGSSTSTVERGVGRLVWEGGGMFVVR